MYIMTITETGRNAPSTESETFNQIHEHLDTIQNVKEYLVERYGKLPQGKSKVYVDRAGTSHIIGFSHSFWNKNYSQQPSKKYFQTDWISFEKHVPNEIPSKDFFKELYS